MEKIIQNKTCKKCSANFEITDKDLEFYDKISPVFDGKKYEIPSPTLCPECRQQRRLSFRMERKLYKRECDATGKNIISIYSPDKNLTVYNQDFRWTDNWDVMDYGIDFNFDDKFFTQFHKLLKKVPKRALVKGTGSENSDYTNGVGASKDCYFMFESANIEKCYYGNKSNGCNNCIDFTGLSKSEYCYQVVDCSGCYELYFSQKCIECNRSQYLYNCNGCSNCFGCINLSNKQYYIFNEQFSKKEYYEKLNIIKERKYSLEEFKKFIQKFPKKNLINIGSENVSGDNIYKSSNVKNSFDISDSSFVSYSLNISKNCNNIFDVYVGLNNSFNIYEGTIVNKRCSNILFSNDIWGECSNLIYCNETKSSHNCFMSTGLDGKSYCIFNRQYSKEEYNKLVPKIIKHMQKTGEWGEFFPSSISPFGYNETVAQEYFPLEKEEIINQNFNYSDYESPTPKVEKIIPAEKLPENIEDIPDDILNWAIKCEVTGKPFRIISQELEFYRKHNLPIPKKHPDQRHKERMKLRNPRKLYDRKCDKCGVDMKTTYSPEREEVVYCDKCYEKEVY